MGLFAPWFLAGFGLLSLPIYFHLLKRHRSETQHFSSLMFFEKSTEASLKHRRLDYLLLMAMRLALLALIVLAFAQPFIWRNTPAGGPSANRVVVIDDSASMGFGNRMSNAKSEASKLMAENVKVAVFDSQLRFVTPADVPRLEVGTSRSSLGELARALRAYQESVKAPLEVHLISDLQRSSMPAGFSDLRLGGETELILHTVADKTEPNWTVESVTAPARVRDGKTVKVQATIAGFHTNAASRTVILEVNGQPAGKQTVQVPASGRAKVEFNGLDLPHGFSKCAVSLQESDGLKVDDRYLFAIERSDPQRVVFLYAERSARSALSSAMHWKPPPPAPTPWRAIPAERPPISKEPHSSWCRTPAASTHAMLKRYVQQGGSALVVLGPANVSAGKVPILGTLVKASRYASRGAERYQTLGTADDAYAAIAKAGRWEGVHFYQSIDADPGQARILARLTDRTPILLEQKIGEGTVVVLASAAGQPRQ
ncbi:MAG: BatA domain-containing protein [Paludibaculum sp.]